LPKFSTLKGLADEGLDAESGKGSADSLSAVGAGENYLEIGTQSQGLLKDFPAGHPRQGHIQQQHIDLIFVRANQFQCGKAVACLNYPKAFLSQHFRYSESQYPFILHHQNSPCQRLMLLHEDCRDSGVARSRSPGDTRQEDLKPGSPTRRADQIDGAAVISNDPLNYREPQTSSGEFCAEERIERFGLRLCCHTTTCIRYLQL
jgi:hypothetical protein